MATVSLGVPGLLRDCIDGGARATLKASTLGEALDEALVAHPRLRVHLFDESGSMRRHVFLALNGRSVKRSAGLAAVLEDGDRIDVLQAVSGG